MDWAAVPLLLPLITMLPILLLCKAGKPKAEGGAEDGLSTLSTQSGTSRNSTASNASNAAVDSGPSSARITGKSDKEKSNVEGKEDPKVPLKSPLGFHKEIVVPIGKASVETPMKSNMSKRENRKKDSSRSSKRVVRFK